MTNSTAAQRAARLKALAQQAIKDYTDELSAGGEPAFPEWTADLLAALRDMLHEDFKMADQRDMAVAEAVRSWYQVQFPHLGVLIDQPDLPAIIEKVRAS